MVPMLLMMSTLTIMTTIMIRVSYDYDDDTDDDNDHKNDNYTAAGAAPGASVPCSLFLAPQFFVICSDFPASGARLPARSRPVRLLQEGPL